MGTSNQLSIKQIICFNIIAAEKVAGDVCQGLAVKLAKEFIYHNRDMDANEISYISRQCEIALQNIFELGLTEAKNNIMGTNNKQSILEGRKWDVIESVDGYFSGEKNGVIIQGTTMSDLYEKCKSFDIASVMEKIKTGDNLNDWEKRLIKVNKKLLENQ